SFLTRRAGTLGSTSCRSRAGESLAPVSEPRAPKEQPLPGTSQANEPLGGGTSGEQAGVPVSPTGKAGPCAGESLRSRDRGAAGRAGPPTTGAGRPRPPMPRLSDLETPDRFVGRHIGPDDAEVAEMLRALQLESLDELTKRAVPASIRDETLELPAACDEREG